MREARRQPSGAATSAHACMPSHALQASQSPSQALMQDTCHLQDCGDGSYGATICLKQAGFATVVVVVNGDPAGPPVTLPVLPGKLHALALVSRGHLRTTAGTHPVLITLHVV